MLLLAVILILFAVTENNNGEAQVSAQPSSNSKIAKVDYPVYSPLIDDGALGMALGQIGSRIQVIPPKNICKDTNYSRCFYNNRKRRDSYCRGYTYNNRYSFNAWYGGVCYCCNPCKRSNREICFLNDLKSRDKSCRGARYSRRFSFYASVDTKGNICHCCTK